MTEHLYTLIIVITYNFTSLKTSFLCYHKDIRDSSFDFEFERIRDSDSFISWGNKSHIFGLREDIHSVICQTEFNTLLLNELLQRRP